MKKITKMLRGGVILLSMMLPLCMWAAETYSEYTHVPGNYIDLNPETNSTTSHEGCQYESGNDNVGYIKNGCSSTYHICVDKKGNYELSMGVAYPREGTFTLTITDEATKSQELEQTFDIPNVKNYAECKFALEKALTAGYKTVKMTYNSGSTGFLMNYKNLTFNALNPVLAKWDFSNSTDGYVQKDGTSSPFLAFYPGEYAYGDNTMFTLSTGGVKGGGLNQAILNTNKDLELKEGYSPSGFISEADMTDGSKHYLYYEISVPTIGFESVTLTARVSHNQSNHNMYAVYSADGGTTWEGTQKVALSNSQSSYLPLSIVIPGGKDNVLVRLHPDNNWYYYLQSCTLSGEMVKSYKVTTNAKGWASFSAVQPVGLPAGLKAYAATDINETHVKLNELTQVAAEEGVFVNGAPSTEYTLNVLEDEVTKEATNLIKPILVASAGHEVATTETVYALATKNEKCGLYLVKSGVTVKGKAYLDASGKGLAKAPAFFDLSDGNSATGIMEVRAAEVQNRQHTCYNALGQRVEKQTKGIILMDGKKVFNK